MVADNTSLKKSNGTAVHCNGSETGISLEAMPLRLNHLRLDIFLELGKAVRPYTGLLHSMSCSRPIGMSLLTAWIRGNNRQNAEWPHVLEWDLLKEINIEHTQGIDNNQKENRQLFINTCLEFFATPEGLKSLQKHFAATGYNLSHILTETESFDPVEAEQNLKISLRLCRFQDSITPDLKVMARLATRLSTFSVDYEERKYYNTWYLEFLTWIFGEGSTLLFPVLQKHRAELI